MYAELECISCKARHAARELYRCTICGGELDVHYDLARIRENGAFANSWKRMLPAIERFRALLPLGDEDFVTLGEGNTPLVRSRNFARRLGLGALYFKLEGSNPTGSFKDRQVSVAISKAQEWSRRRFATVSSGNVGVALSAYAARSGGEALVWVPGEAALAKHRQIEVYGARLFVLPAPVDGDAGAYFSAVSNLARFSEAHGLVPMISARAVNPYMVEGGKAIAYEIVAELGRSPDILFAPAGGGGLVGGLWKAFRELVALDLARASPVLRGAQRKAYFAPIDALDDPAYGSEKYYRPLDGEWAWSSIRESNGGLDHVSDDEIRAAQAALAEHEGIFAEPHGAYAAASLVRAAQIGSIDREACIVCVVSGFGLKDMAAADAIVEGRSRAPQEVASLEASVRYIGAQT